MTNSVKFLPSKKRRAELKLPQTHFIAMDDWVDKIGNDAYVAWLKFYTWADRSAADRDADTIPSSMTKIIEKLKTNRKAFYNNIIRPLWNHGFIDLQTIMTPTKGQLVNIVVYEYPQDDTTLAIKPLEKMRDYDTDYKPEERAAKAKRSRKVQGGVSQGNKGVFPEETGGCFSGKQGGVSQGNTLMSLNQSNNDFEYLKANLLEYLSNLSSDQISQKVKDWLSKQVYNDRLTDTKLKSVVNLYVELRSIYEFEDVAFLSICNNVLDYKSRNFKRYLKTSLETHFKTQAEGNANPERKQTEDSPLTQHPAYEVVASLHKKWTSKNMDYPMSIRTQLACEAIQEQFELTYSDARHQLQELQSLGFAL